LKTKKGPGTLGPFENLTYNPPAKPSASDDLPLPREIFVHGNEKFLNALLDRLRHPGLDHFGIFAGISAVSVTCGGTMSGNCAIGID
jgi:hypothetical protein